ncbi:RAMP superfamily CRISPR-associated protein [Halalkalibacterium halodurans]|uniref:RAMP superfamily CRISPR-associated protein n=1 Tax=Halalkalibacterium halodurans TaxID=86665 RepID=UPI002E22C786|nr:RAMP superfamily CRISPR-associated protein [Halalkalibacterium halodurans]
MIEKTIYSFTLKARSPLSFGSLESEIDMDLINTDTKIKVSGNSIGGALREYLEGNAVDKKEIILAYMGGVAEQEDSEDAQDEESQPKEKFIESSIYISDGELNPASVEEKEGTSINSETGTATKHQKYKFKYFPRGTKLTFTIECDVENGKPVGKNIEITFDELVKGWAAGFHKGEIRLGREKSNGFGLLNVVSLEKKVFSFNDVEAIEEYIFHRKEKQFEEVDLAFLPDTNEINSTIAFTLSGSFPYGVYQAFYDKSLSKEKATVTGLQQVDDQYYIPATSIKGLLRHEVSLLLQQISGSEDKVNAKCGELFGDTNQQGKLRFTDVFLENSERIRIEREAKDSSTLPIYIKIDRLTGGALNNKLKHQNEVIGESKIEIELRDEGVPLEDNPYVFPLVYVLRRIGSGKVPIGGRTVIGLGEFHAHKTIINNKGEKLEIPNLTDRKELDDRVVNQPLEYLVDKPDVLQLLEKSFKSFERWVNDETQTV